MALRVKEAVYLSKSPSLTTLCEGWVWIVLDNDSVQRMFLILRPPFVFLFDQPDGVSDTEQGSRWNDGGDEAHRSRRVQMTSLIDVEATSGSVSASIFLSHTAYRSEEKKSDETASCVSVELYRNNKLFFTMVPIDVGLDVWLSAFRSACAVRVSVPSTSSPEFFEPAERESPGSVSAEPLCVPQAAVSDTKQCATPLANHLRQDLFMKEEDVKKLTYQNSCLQQSMDAAIKAAGEILEQKNGEVRWIEGRLHRLLGGQRKMHQELMQLRELLNDKSTLLLAANKQLAAERERYHILTSTLQSNKDKDKHQLVLQLTNNRHQLQDLMVKNRRLREELSSGTRYLEELQRSFCAQVDMVKEALEASDAVDLLRQQLNLALLVIQTLRRCEPLTQDERAKLDRRVSELQRDIRLRDASAKSFYIKLRSMLLTHQLDCMRGAVKHFELYDLMKNILDRYAWILGESGCTALIAQDPLQQGTQQNEDAPASHPTAPSWTVTSRASVLPHSCQSFYPRWNTVGMYDRQSNILLLPPRLLLSSVVSSR